MVGILRSLGMAGNWKGDFVRDQLRQEAKPTPPRISTDPGMLGTIPPGTDVVGSTSGRD